VQALQTKLRDLGKDATLYVHPGTEHAFFNDTRPEVYDAAESAIAFDRTVDLFRTSL
jgi:carboxymethylenebutenolidase